MLGVTCCIGNLRHAIMKSKRGFFISYCTSSYCSALWSTYKPKNVMDEIHIAHNDDHYSNCLYVLSVTPYTL